MVARGVGGGRKGRRRVKAADCAGVCGAEEGRRKIKA